MTVPILWMNRDPFILNRMEANILFVNYSINRDQ